MHLRGLVQKWCNSHYKISLEKRTASYRYMVKPVLVPTQLLKGLRVIFWHIHLCCLYVSQISRKHKSIKNTLWVTYTKPLISESTSIYQKGRKIFSHKSTIIKLNLR